MTLALGGGGLFWGISFAPFVFFVVKHFCLIAVNSRQLSVDSPALVGGTAAVDWRWADCNLRGSCDGRRAAHRHRLLLRFASHGRVGRSPRRSRRAAEWQQKHRSY